MPTNDAQLAHAADFGPPRQLEYFHALRALAEAADAQIRWTAMETLRGGTMRLRTCVTAFTGLLLCSVAQAQEPETVYRGRPAIKVTVAATEQRSEKVESKDAPNLTCVISKIGDNFYWASRENRPLTASRSGAFLVFVAEGGTGYIKIIIPDMKEAAALMGETEAKYDYVEHITFGLGSVTYYGKRQQ